jgi:hypothetical protein
VDSREDQWLAERLAIVEAELDRLDARAPALNAKVADPSEAGHEQAKWTALWDLRQRALLIEERDAIVEARERINAQASA